MALAVVVVYGAALAISPAGTLDSLTYHLDRPVQVESSPAAVLRGLDALDAGTTEHIHSHRSDGLEHRDAGLVTAAFAALLVGALGLLAVGAADRGGGAPGPRSLVLASLAALVAFAALGKVLSPQFLVWVVPLAALAFAWRMHALAVTATAAILLTLIEFPAHYEDVVAGAPAAVWLVVARNAALFAVLAIVVWTLWSARPASVEARGVRGHVVPEHLAVGSEYAGLVVQPERGDPVGVEPDHDP